MKLGSLFAGVEGFGLGFRQAGFEELWQVEINGFCRSILRRHFPKVKRFSNVKRCGAKNLRSVDVITAGFPCQDLSVAGKRAGLEGSRSGLFWECVRIVGELRPRWLVLENVPGLFSSSERRDFAIILRALGELGVFQSIAWRVLDSRYFGVAQRRRRVFLVCGARIGSAESVLFESESGGGDSAEGGEERPDIACPLTSGVGVTGNAPGRRREDDYNLAYCLREDPGGIGQGHNTTYVSAPIGCGLSKLRHDQDGYPEHLVAASLRASDGHHGYGSGRGDGQDNLIAHSITQSSWKRHDEDTDTLVSAEIDPDRSGDAAGVSEGMDDSMLPKGLDSARYRACGNAVTVSVANWIARRILAAEARQIG